MYEINGLGLWIIVEIYFVMTISNWFMQDNRRLVYIGSVLLSEGRCGRRETNRVVRLITKNESVVGRNMVRSYNGQ